MQAIQHYELIAAAIDNWAPSDIAFIRSINIFPQDVESGRTDMLMHFLSQARQRNNKGWPDRTCAFREISLIFRDVSTLQLKLGGGGLHPVAGFDIEHITERGWEGINFSIDDYENGTISFYCREIAVRSISDPTYLTSIL